MNDILEQVQSGDFDPLKMFTGNKDKFLEVKTAIENISNNLTKETCIEFLLSKIIPTAFDKNVSDATRDEAVEIGFHLLKFVNISILNTKDQERIFTSIEETYAKTVGELRDSNYENWDKLWIFIIRLCHERIHSKMSVANKLLRVVEVAFRNSTSIEQRLKAYDCWKELIDNCSLNMEHMCSAKQIKLLVTPLKAKFSRTPIVINKRCDIFVYLLEKLQDKATLCLKEFLEFCFGPFDEKNAETEKMKQGKSVPDVCMKSTKFLTAILGHSHSDKEKCIRSDDIRVSESIINQKNFPDFAEILLSSVVECCVLLKEWNTDSYHCNTIIKCLWRSVLIFIHESSDDVKKKCYTQLNSLMRKMLERSEPNNNKFTPVILGNVVELLLKHGAVDDNLREIVFDVTMSLLRRLPIDSCPIDEEELLRFVTSCFETENGSKFSKIASNSFRNDGKSVSSDALCEVWLKCNSLSQVAHLIWPVRHLQRFKDVDALNAKWTALYNAEAKSESFKTCILQEMEKLFAENPLLSSNVVSFLKLISATEATSSKDFVARLMRLIELVLTLPNLSGTDLKQLSAIVLGYCDQKRHLYKADGIDEAVDKLCGCLQHLITIHKNYAVLTDLHDHLQQASPKVLAKFSKRLMSVLEALMLSEDNHVANDTRKLIELLENKGGEPDSIPLASTRSLRIMNMTNTMSPKPPKMSKLRLFGKSEETSLISKKRNKSFGDKKKEVGVVVDEDKSSDYVRVETEVKLDLSVLNEHQKEMLKRRREDIPALYQDLTQSQSQDFFVDSNEASGESSKENLIAVDPKLVLGPPPPPPVVEEAVNEPDPVEEKEVAEEATSKVSEEELPKAEETTEKSVEDEEKPAEEAHLLKRTPEQDNKDEIVEESKEADEEKAEESTVKAEEDNVEEVEKKAVRKSGRQLRRRENDHVHRKVRRSKSKETSTQPETDKEDPDSTSIDTGDSEEKKKADEDDAHRKTVEEPSSLRKSKRQQDKRQQNETIEDLLFKIDKQIMQKKRKYKKRSTSKSKSDVEESPKTGLSDGNQNKILLDRSVEEENEEKQEKIRQIVSKVKKQVMRTVSSDSMPETSTSSSSMPETSTTVNDVYEFTGDDDPVVEDLKKSAKKTKKSRLSFGRDAYVTKRRKKAKNNNKASDGRDEEEVAASFHVTADYSTPVPLSKSQSLRAVPSPQESETITIVITRSPPEEQAKEKEEQPSPSKRRGKRKSASPEVNSEDVIESSQPVTSTSTSDGTKRGRGRPPGRSRSDAGEDDVKRKTRNSSVEKKPEEAEDVSAKAKQIRRLSLTESSGEEVKMAKRTTHRSKSLDRFDADSEVTFLTETSSQELPDTLTQQSEEQDDKDKEDLPGSPVTCDTPDRTTELLNNTSDISPINSSQEDEEITKTSTTTPKIASAEMSNVRVARLLQMVNSNVQVSERQWFGQKRTTSPSTTRVKRMRLKKEENLDILTFSRQVPSPLTVPASGILKRKFSALDEGATPSPKRKRVNFSDPAITDKKIFIKDTEEYETTDQNNDSTKELQDSTEDREDNVDSVFSDRTKKEDAILSVKEFCDANLKVLAAVDGSGLKKTLKRLVQDVDVPEITEVVSEYITRLEKKSTTEVNGVLDDPVDNPEEVFDVFLPRLMGVLEGLPDEKVHDFRIELTKAFDKTRLNKFVKEELTDKEAEEHVVNNFDCDRMKEMIKRYFVTLEDGKRNEFFVDLMSLAGEELPVTWELVNWHINILQKLVKRMRD